MDENVALSKWTTFRIGGPAKYFTSVANIDELKKVLDFARSKNLPILVLGNGSNVLISDEGFNGLVIHNQINGLQTTDYGLVTIGAGENWDNVVLAAVVKNLAGIECLSGVPGSTGGAVVQNIGAYGQTIGDHVVSVTATEVSTGEEKVFSAQECQFEYRTSFFKNNPNMFIVTSLQIKLEPHGQPTLSYAHIAKHFANKPNPMLKELRELVLRIRASKGYLIMPEFECFNTAGSFFKNPIVDSRQFEKLKPILGDLESNRFWETASGYKIAAAFLMQEAGFIKGFRQGNVGISPKHALSLVNFGGATAAEVKTLALDIKNAVLKKFGVALEEEVRYI